MNYKKRVTKRIKPKPKRSGVTREYFCPNCSGGKKKVFLSTLIRKDYGVCLECNRNYSIPKLVRGEYGKKKRDVITDPRKFKISKIILSIIRGGESKGKFFTRKDLIFKTLDKMLNPKSVSFVGVSSGYTTWETYQKYRKYGEKVLGKRQRENLERDYKTVESYVNGLAGYGSTTRINPEKFPYLAKEGKGRSVTYHYNKEELGEKEMLVSKMERQKIRDKVQGLTDDMRQRAKILKEGKRLIPTRKKQVYRSFKKEYNDEMASILSEKGLNETDVLERWFVESKEYIDPEGIRKDKEERGLSWAQVDKILFLSHYDWLFLMLPKEVQKKDYEYRKVVLLPPILFQTLSDFVRKIREKKGRVIKYKLPTIGNLKQLKRDLHRKYFDDYYNLGIYSRGECNARAFKDVEAFLKNDVKETKDIRKILYDMYVREHLKEGKTPKAAKERAEQRVEDVIDQKTKGANVYHYLEVASKNYNPSKTREFKSDLNMFFRRKFMLEHPGDFSKENVERVREHNENPPAALREIFEEMRKSPKGKKQVQRLDEYGKKQVGLFTFFVLSRNRTIDLSRHDPRKFVELHPLQWQDISSVDMARNLTINNQGEKRNVAEFRRTVKRTNKPHMKVHSGSLHSLNYHVMCNTKYRLPVFNDEEIKTKIIENMKSWCARNMVLIKSMVIDEEHIHAIMEFHIVVNPHKFLQQFKQELGRFCRSSGVPGIKGAQILQSGWSIEGIGHSTVNVVENYLSSHALKGISERRELAPSLRRVAKQIFPGLQEVITEVPVASPSKLEGYIDFIAVSRKEKEMWIWVCETKVKGVNSRSFRQLKAYLTSVAFWNQRKDRRGRCVGVRGLMEKYGIKHPTAVHVVGLMIAPQFSEDCKVHFEIPHKTVQKNEFFIHCLKLSPLERRLIRKGKTERFLFLDGVNVITGFMGLPNKKSNRLRILIHE